METILGDMEMKRIATSQVFRDRMHVAAFRSIFKAHPDLKPEARLAYAIVATCDEALDLSGKDALVQQWILTYGEESGIFSTQDEAAPVPWPGH